MDADDAKAIYNFGAYYMPMVQMALHEIVTKQLSFGDRQQDSDMP